jgi:aldehyde dehydrogenase (NAD+)
MAMLHQQSSKVFMISVQVVCFSLIPFAHNIDIDVPALVEGLRQTFATDKTRSKEWRFQQLRNFLKMIDEEGPELCEAMRQDLHKSPLEGYLTELGLVKAEIETAIENLDSWMEPIKTRNSALNIPCWSTTQRDPLGVVLIMGAWNYPMQVTLLSYFFFDPVVAL